MKPSSIDESSFSTAWWDSTLDADHWLSLSAITPAQAALLLSGFNPHEGDLEHHREVENQEALRRLYERFVDESEVDRRRRRLQEWLEYAEAHALEHSPWLRHYLEAVGSGHSLDRNGAKVGHATGKPGPKKRTSWWHIAGTYVVQRMREGRYSTAKSLYRAIQDEPASDKSPFETIGRAGNRTLIVRETGRPVAFKSMQNKWTDIKAAASAPPAS